MIFQTWYKDLQPFNKYRYVLLREVHRVDVRSKMLFCYKVRWLIFLAVHSRPVASSRAEVTLFHMSLEYQDCVTIPLCKDKIFSFQYRRVISVNLGRVGICHPVLLFFFNSRVSKARSADGWGPKRRSSPESPPVSLSVWTLAPDLAFEAVLQSRHFF